MKNVKNKRTDDDQEMDYVYHHKDDKEKVAHLLNNIDIDERRKLQKRHIFDVGKKTRNVDKRCSSSTKAVAKHFSIILLFMSILAYLRYDILL